MKLFQLLDFHKYVKNKIIFIRRLDDLRLSLNATYAYGEARL